MPEVAEAHSSNTTHPVSLEREDGVFREPATDWSRYDATTESAEAFSEHVASVRTGGDSLNTRLSYVRARLGTVAVGMLATEAAAISINENLPRLHLAAAVASGAGLVYNSRITFKEIAAWKLHDQRVGGGDVRQGLGESYQLFRVKDGSVVLNWRGSLPVDNSVRSAHKSMRLIAALAQQNGIERIVVGTDTLESAGITSAPGNQTKLKRWLRRNRGKKFSSNVPDESVYELTPTELSALAEGCREKDDIIEYRISQLKEIDPDHPIVKTFEGSKNQPGILSKNLGRVCRGALLREITDVADCRLVQEGPFIVKRHAWPVTDIVGSNARMMYQDRIETRPLLWAIGFNKESFARSLDKDSASTPEQHKRALILALYEHIQDSSEAPLYSDDYVEAVDFAPYTEHVETVVLMSRAKD